MVGKYAAVSSCLLEMRKGAHMAQESTPRWIANTRPYVSIYALLKGTLSVLWRRPGTFPLLPEHVLDIACSGACTESRPLLNPVPNRLRCHCLVVYFVTQNTLFIAMCETITLIEFVPSNLFHRKVPNIYSTESFQSMISFHLKCDNVLINRESNDSLELGRLPTRADSRSNHLHSCQMRSCSAERLNPQIPPV